MTSKRWVIGWAAAVLAVLWLVGAAVYHVDPFFHYHAPLTERYYYRLNNQRSQNDGIVKHFTYDAMIVGTSMAENFRTSEMDALFGTHSVKACFSGASFKELDRCISTALEYNPDLKLVIRGIDLTYLLQDKDVMRLDLGAYPEYLYDKNPLNDVNYLFNRDVIWKRVAPMLTARREADFQPGITSFDDFGWAVYSAGRHTVYDEPIQSFTPAEPSHLTQEQRELIQASAEQNILATARAHPEVSFCCFFTPYSAAWWMERVEVGNFHTYLEATEYYAQLMLELDNIHVYSFADRFDLLTDLNNYRDGRHYMPWINSLILRWIHDDAGRLTRENYKAHFQSVDRFYSGFDIYSFNDQPDYEQDEYAAALVRQELTGIAPLALDPAQMELSGAELAEDQHDGQPGILCTGTLSRAQDSEPDVADCLREQGYLGASAVVEDAGQYDYLVFYGRKVRNHGQPYVALYDSAGAVLKTLSVNYRELDGEWQMYLMDLSDVSGAVRIIFHGGFVDERGSERSAFVFSDIKLY